MVQKHTVEFNQLAMANSEGSEAMLNRVMTKDNIGVAVLLEVHKEMMEQSGEDTHTHTHSHKLGLCSTCLLLLVELWLLSSRCVWLLLLARC